jgi:PKD repeat protein
MAARILRYTQCQPNSTSVTIGSAIIIESSTGSIVNRTIFPKGSTDLLTTITGTGTWDKRWTLTNTITWVSLMSNDDRYPLSNLGCGTWINTVDFIERSTGRIVSTASNTITIDCNEQNSKQISLSITANPISVAIGKPVNLTARVGGGSGAISYHWSYGDGTTNNMSGNTNHIYSDNGIYTVTLTIIDTLWNTAQSSLVIVVSGDRDTDSDTIFDTSDLCPLVYALTPTGCPTLTIYDPRKISWDSIWTGRSIVSNNICLTKREQSQWLLIGTPNCTQCPCANTIDISSALRSCDIVFPTILSPALDTVYSRGGFFLIP